MTSRNRFENKSVIVTGAGSGIGRETALAVTLKSVWLGCKFAIPHMVKGGGGAIVNTASTAAFIAGPSFAAYIAAKGGVVALTRSVAYDFGKQGIRCNGVAPGLIETPATVDVFNDPARVGPIRAHQLLGRHGQPREIADAVLFVASEDSAYMTGQTIVLDGGRLAG